MKRIFFFVITIVLLVACSPSPEEIAAQTHSAATATAILWTKTPTSTPTPTNTPTPTATFTPIPTPTPLGGSGQLIFNKRQCNDEWRDCVTSIILLNLTTMEQTGILEEGYYLQDISPDGQQILVSQKSNLFVVNMDGSNPILLSENSSGYSYWLAESGRIVFIGKEGKEAYVYIVNSDGTGITRITKPGASPIRLYPTNNETRVYWEKGYETYGALYLQGTYWTNIDGSEQELLDLEKPEFSPTGEYVVYINNWISQNLIVSKVDGTEEVHIKTGDSGYPGVHVWSPKSDKLFIEIMICTPDCDASKYYLFSPSGDLLAEFPGDLGWCDGFGWSPDGRMIFLVTWQTMGEEYKHNFYLIDLDTLIITTLDLGNTKNSMIWNINWIPYQE